MNSVFFRSFIDLYFHTMKKHYEISLVKRSKKKDQNQNLFFTSGSCF